jgi:hypothetical protein
MPALAKPYPKTSNTHNFWTVAPKIMKFALIQSLFRDASSQKVSKFPKIVWGQATLTKTGLVTLGTYGPLGVNILTLYSGHLCRNIQEKQWPKGHEKFVYHCIALHKVWIPLYNGVEKRYGHFKIAAYQMLGITFLLTSLTLSWLQCPNESKLSSQQRVAQPIGEPCCVDGPVWSVRTFFQPRCPNFRILWVCTQHQI